MGRTRLTAQTIAADTAEWPSSAEAWAQQQYGTVALSDARLNQRVPQMAARMAAHPAASLPNQMADPALLKAAYRLLNHERVSMAQLLLPHRQQTLAAARQQPVVLFIEDTTELDYTTHPETTHLGPIGNGHGRGFLLHSTLAVLPDELTVLGLAHAQTVVRPPRVSPTPHRRHTAESQVWEVSVQQVGRPPENRCWVHVSDRGSDVFAYLVACVDLGKHFVVRAYQNRVRVGAEAETTALHVIDEARRWSPHPGGDAVVAVSARPHQPARQAQVVLQWGAMTISGGSHVRPDLRGHAPLPLWVIRVWEPHPPDQVEPLEWILLTDQPITTLDEAQQTVRWYRCRWIVEDYHMCLKTGCRVEQRQLDDRGDLERLLGFAAPIAVRLLQLRQQARQTPERPAAEVVDRLLLEVLARCQRRPTATLTIDAFWRAVARLGGYQDRRGDGPPGWRTLWKGWCYLADLTEGARLVTDNPLSGQVVG
jgi:hypothetical protein